MSLTHANGTSAHCNVVNGGSDRQATLVCPKPYFEQAQIEWRQYRSRLNPTSHREARYFESLSGLPDLSDIRIEIETNVTLLDRLSSAEIWKEAPPDVRNNLQATSGKANHPKPKKNPSNSHTKRSANTTAKKDQHTDDSTIASETTRGEATLDGCETRSTSSTEASTNAPSPDSTSRFNELERVIKQSQKRSNPKGKASAAQLSGLQSQFSELDGKLSSLQDNQQKLATDISSMQHQTASQFEELREGNLMSSMEVTNDMSLSMVEIRAQFSRMSTFMIEMAKKMDTVLSRCDGVPPEVNFSQHPRHNQQDSDVSSVIGDPSQTAQSDNSKTVSQPSSAGQRSIAATQGRHPTPTEVAQPPPPSPIKKKQRARTSIESQNSGHDDEASESDEKQHSISKNVSIKHLKQTKTRTTMQPPRLPATWKLNKQSLRQPKQATKKISARNQHTQRKLPRTNNTTTQMVRLERDQNDTCSITCSRAEATNLAAAGTTVLAFYDKLDVEWIHFRRSVSPTKTEGKRLDQPKPANQRPVG